MLTESVACTLHATWLPLVEFLQNAFPGAERAGAPKVDMEGPKAAAAALNEMLSAEQCRLLVEAIINKYILLSAEELQEWQACAWLTKITPTNLRNSGLPVP